ncbi:MAG: LysE family translocator [Actinobacteria bacterium]|nr:LysE family translocator [Actinomycetota bacterium]
MIGFFLVAAVVIVTPGQDTALTIRNTLAGARRGGVATAAGVSAGQAVWTLATSVGLAAVIAASEPVFRAVKLAGAAYLVVLGLQSLRDAMRRRTRPTSERAAPSVGTSRAFRQGLLSNLGNPKMAIFFTSLLPQFGGESFGALLALGLVFCTMTFVWLSAYAAAVAKAGDVLRRPAIRRVLDAIVGAVLIGLGLRLATERR